MISAKNLRELCELLNKEPNIDLCDIPTFDNDGLEHVRAYMLSGYCERYGIKAVSWDNDNVLVFKDLWKIIPIKDFISEIQP